MNGRRNALRLPAEWEPHAFTAITWPSRRSDWAPMHDAVVRTYRDLASAIARFEPLLIITDDVKEVSSQLHGIRRDNLDLFQAPVNDSWTRDHAFLSLVEDNGQRVHLVDFQFNGWGLKYPANHDNLINTRLAQGPLKGNVYHSCLNVVLEGGSVESDGRGSLLTTSACLLAPNRNRFTSHYQAERVLKPLLNAERVLWIDTPPLPGDDTDGHVDTLARFAPGNAIVHVSPPAEGNPLHDALQTMRQQIASFSTPEGDHYRLVPLPVTPAICDAHGAPLPATYANFYFVEGAILLPVYGVATDQEALDVMAEAFPSYQIVAIDCRTLIEQHGSLHCSTMQFPLHTNLRFGL